MASLTYKLDSSSLTTTTINVYSLAAGSHTLVVTAVDGMGNTSSTNLTFVLNPSLTGLKDAVIAGYNTGSITASEDSTLLSILNNTSKTEATNLSNFYSAVSSSGKAITSAEATILESWEQNLAYRVAHGLPAADLPRSASRSGRARTEAARHRRTHHSRHAGRHRARARRASARRRSR